MDKNIKNIDKWSGPYLPAIILLIQFKFVPLFNILLNIINIILYHFNKRVNRKMSYKFHSLVILHFIKINL